MKYRKLNEVLIEWNESSNEELDNVFLKSEDIKESLERYFVYKLNCKTRIKIFDENWPELEKYKDKVWINGKHVELDYKGYTINEFESGKYKVYIEDIDKVTDMTYMFYDCKQLVSVFILDSVTSIGEWMFSGCTGLTSVDVPNSVTSIGENAFNYCTRLTSATIGNSVTSISDGVFQECYDLTSVTIPSSVTYIGAWAFHDCAKLKIVYVEDINKFNQIQFGNKTADPRYYGAKVIELKNKTY